MYPQGQKARTKACQHVSVIPPRPTLEAEHTEPSAPVSPNDRPAKRQCFDADNPTGESELKDSP